MRNPMKSNWKAEACIDAIRKYLIPFQKDIIKWVMYIDNDKNCNCTMFKTDKQILKLQSSDYVVLCKI
jgi:hypothetical protein